MLSYNKRRRLYFIVNVSLLCSYVTTFLTLFLFIYSKFEKNYETGPYVPKENNFETRPRLTKLRVSDHILKIERGRYKYIKKKNVNVNIVV